MKVRICFFILIALVNSVISKADHPYRPFVKEGKRWVTSLVIYTISGDTIINDIDYRKVYRNTNKRDKYALGDYYAAVQEVDKVVYTIEKDSVNPVILCDFNIIFKDSEKYDDGYRREDYTEIDTPKGLFYYCRLVSTTPLTNLELLVEGVGWLHDPFDSRHHGFNDEFEACYEDGQLLFHCNSSSRGCPKMGDIEPDGMVDVHDLNAIVTVAGYFEPWYPHWVFNALDVNCDLYWDTRDVDALINMVLGKEVIYFGGYPMTY